MKIYIQTKESALLPHFIDKGDWVDLKSNENVFITGPHVDPSFNTERGRDMVRLKDRKIDLGVAMQLPAGFEAHVLPRSSLFKKKGVMLVNSMGIIDNTYCGPDDWWCFWVIATRDTSITKFENIAQFRITLSQKATFWQKLRWLFCRKIEFVSVDRLNNKNRGGTGSTGGMKHA